MAVALLSIGIISFAIGCCLTYRNLLKLMSRIDSKDKIKKEDVNDSSTY